MTAQGVTEFATVNVKDFEGMGFRKVWNPIGMASEPKYSQIGRKPTGR
jgi:hypothetical protein